MNKKGIFDFTTVEFSSFIYSELSPTSDLIITIFFLKKFRAKGKMKTKIAWWDEDEDEDEDGDDDEDEDEDEDGVTSWVESWDDMT